MAKHRSKVAPALEALGKLVAAGRLVLPIAEYGACACVPCVCVCVCVCVPCVRLLGRARLCT